LAATDNLQVITKKKIVTKTLQTAAYDKERSTTLGLFVNAIFFQKSLTEIKTIF
jgi:hypothetical protein